MRKQLKRTRKQLRRARTQITEAQHALPAEVEEVIRRVGEERLSFLGPEHLRNLASCIRQLESDGVPGLVIEAGTAQGGSAIVLATAKSLERPMKVYDVFDTIPAPGPKDGADVHERYAAIAAGGATGTGDDTYYGYRDDLYGEVRRSFERLGVPVEKHGVELVKGLFQDTIEIDGPVALAHLDGDWYDSTMVCLERIAPMLSPGGRLVIDDYYSWSGCHRAVNDYFKGRREFHLLERAKLHVVRAEATAIAVTTPRLSRVSDEPEPTQTSVDESETETEDEDVVAKLEELLRDGTPESLAAAVEMGRATAGLRTRDLAPLAARFLVTGHPDLARDLVEEAEQRRRDGGGGGQRRRLDRLRTWTHPADRPAPPPDAVSLGIFCYSQPDPTRSSKNIGDYVQTLAMLSNLVRFSDVELSGPDGFGELATEVQSRVRPELRLEAGRRRVHLVPVSRDFSAGDQIPDGTWLLAFGWHLHPPFGLRYGLPFDPRLRPLFVSFHLWAIDALDDPTIAYLRAHGPIGCRDWTTVDLLLSAGVDAFFTGCVTSSIDAVFPPLDSVDRSGARAVGLVDISAPDDLPTDQPVVEFENGDPAFRDLDIVRGTRAVLDMFDDYQVRLDRVVTSRLHAYLPAISMGFDVDFRPTSPGNARFTGLSGMRADSAELDRMRDGIRDLIADALGRILADAPVEEVYDAWRTRTAPLVEQARARFHAPHAPRGPVSTAATVARLERDAVVEVGGRTARWTIEPGASAADALALPGLLPELDRLVLVDAGEELTDVEIARLAEVDLRGNPVGACLSTEAAAWVWRRLAEPLDPESAGELRRLMSARHPFATRAIGPGPIVLDLASMRADPDLPECLGIAAEFEMGARDAVLAYAGQRVTPLEHRS